jgi:hypothetical protein
MAGQFCQRLTVRQGGQIIADSFANASTGRHGIRAADTFHHVMI